MARSPLRNYLFPLLLLASVLAGAFIGVFAGERAAALKPFGDIFLNLLFTAAVPLVFFSISSAVAGMADLRLLRKILACMMLIFIATGVLSSLLMIAGVKIFHPALTAFPALQAGGPAAEPLTPARILSAFTVSDFPDLLSRRNILALIVMALLTGLAASSAGEKGKPFASFLASGNEVMMKLISFIMLYAPAGLGAYFAYFTGMHGPDMLGSYARVVALYYPLAILYFFAGSSFYAWLAGGRPALGRFWKHIPTPAFTALATGSSLATVPSNLQAADAAGVPKPVSRIVIPIGATIHMDGTCLSAILKISVLFSMFQMDFSGAGTLAAAIGIALLSGMVMSGIPGGGFLGELLIVTLYGFPPEALPVISLLGTLVDPPATMVNATGDNAASMLTARLIHGKRWMEKESAA